MKAAIKTAATDAILSTAADAGISGGLKGAAVQKGVEIVGQAIDNPVGWTAKATHMIRNTGRYIKDGFTLGTMAVVESPVIQVPAGWMRKWSDNKAIDKEVESRLDKKIEAWKKQQRAACAKPDEAWEKELKKKASQMRDLLKEQTKKEVERDILRAYGVNSMEELHEKRDVEMKEGVAKEVKKEKTKAEANIVSTRTDDHVRDWMGIDPEKNPRESMLYDYAGGTQMSQFLENLKVVSDNDTKGWRKLRDVDWSKGAGAAAEMIGNLTKGDEGSKWSPTIGAGIAAAKTFLGVTNPVLGAAMDVAGLLATNRAARALTGEALKLGWSGAKLAGKGMKWLATRVGDGAIRLFKKPKKEEPPKEEKKEEPIPQRQLDYSGVNIPNLLPQESNAAYMMRMTGGMNVGPANANVVSYSGYRKPQYEKVDNRVMLAPPRVVKKKVRVKRRRT